MAPSTHSSNGASRRASTAPRLGAPTPPKRKARTRCDELLQRIRATLPPCDRREEIWIRDIVELVWVTLRLRRIKAVLMTETTASSIGNVGLNDHGRKDDAVEIRRRWTAGDMSAAQRVHATPAQNGISMDTPFARTLASALKEDQAIDCLLAQLERRRSAALRELDRHRAPFGQKLRLSIAREEAALVPDAPPVAATEPA
jgi:hypothetical protein